MAEYILVPLDGSALAESTLPLNISLARLTSSGIILLRAVPPPESVDTPADRDRGELCAARDYLDGIRKDLLREDGLEVRTEVVEGAPATAIVEYAEQNADVWLIAMATRHGSPTGPLGPWSFGSVSERVLHTTHKPVLLARPDRGSKKEAVEQDPTGPLLHTIIVPLDGTCVAERALVRARQLALLTDATLALIGAVPPSDYREVDQVEFMRVSVDVARGNEAAHLARYLANTAAGLRAEGLQVLTELLYGHPAEMILLAANRLHGDLIVMAVQGKRDLERVWLGSIAQKLVQSSTMPVLLTRVAT